MGAEFLINDYLYYTEHFNHTEYPVLFDRYLEALQSYLSSADQESAADTAASLIAAAESNISRYRLRFRRDAALVDSTMMFSLFIVPALIRIGTPQAETLTDLLISGWNERHPDAPVRRGTFEDICEGFKWKLW